MSAHDPTARQPNPLPSDGEDCWLLVMNDAARHPALSEPSKRRRSCVVADMRARREYGLQEYGRPLVPFNGSNAFAAAYRECLDMLVHLRQSLEEGNLAATDAYEEALDLVFTLRGFLPPPPPEKGGA